MAVKSPSWVQQDFRFRLDDGSQASATFAAAENVTASHTNGEVFRLRLNIGDINAAGASNNVSWKVQYNKDGAGWVTASATGPVVLATSAFVSDGNNDPNQRLLTNFGGTTFSSAWQEFDTNNTLTAHVWSDDYTEYEFALQTSATAGASIAFRVIASDGNVPTVSNTPTLIVVEAIVAQTVIPSAIASAATAYNVSISTSIAVAPDTVASAETVHDPILSTGPVTVSPDAIASGETVHDPVLAIGAQTVEPDTIVSVETVNDPTIQVGATSVIPDAVGATEVVDNPLLAPQGITLGPDAIASQQTVFDVTLLASITVTPDAIAAAETVYDPDLILGSVTIAPDATASLEQVYDITIQGSQTIEPDTIAAAETVYDPALVTSSAAFDTYAFDNSSGTGAFWTDPISVSNVVPVFIASAEVVYSVTLLQDWTVIPDHIASTEVVHDPALSQGQIIIQPDAIASVEAVHDPVVLPQAVTVVPDHIASTEAVHDPVITQLGGDQTVIPDVISSGEVVYDPRLIGGAGAVEQPTVGGSGGSRREPAMISPLIRWGRKRKKMDAQVREVASAVMQVARQVERSPEVAPIYLPPEFDYTEVARTILSHHRINTLRGMAFKEFSRRVEAALNEMDDEEVLLLALA